MRGAQLRVRRERALAYEAAVLPYLKKTPSLQEFVGLPQDRTAYVREFESKWDRVDAALRRNR